MGMILGLQAGVFAQGRVVINEFSTGFSYKNGQDFIELKNVGMTDANIGNFTIVTENEIIRIPRQYHPPCRWFLCCLCNKNDCCRGKQHHHQPE